MHPKREVKALTKEQAAKVAKEVGRRGVSHSQKGISVKSGKVSVNGKDVVLE